MSSRLLWGFGALAVLVCATSARAEDQPPLVPTRDVAVTYHVKDPQGTARVVHMFFDAADQRVHIDLTGRPGFLVIDHKSGQVTVVNSEAQSYVQMHAPPAMGNLMFRTPDLRFTRKGTDKVAGYACTVWSLAGGQSEGGDACITADGVVLSGHPEGAPSPETGIQAVSVVYGPQPASLFAPPAGYQRVTPPAPGQMGGPGGGAAPPAGAAGAPPSGPAPTTKP